MNNLIDNRQIRVFISSTFQDMQDERNYLMTKTFPRLRRMAEQRNVSLIEVDLRWGITSEESENGKTLQICLNEIDNSRPFFIGILGDRYGWCPSKQDLNEDDILNERFSWINSYMKEEKSVTEMQYGALCRELNQGTEQNVWAAFYIKRNEAVSNFEDADACAKLQQLKDAVRNNISNYPCSDYTSPEELGSLVESDFVKMMDELFPELELTDLEKERMVQRSFVFSQKQVYVRRQSDFDAIDSFLADSSKGIMVVSGPNGIGKKALLANWIAGYEATFGEKERIFIYHFVGVGEAECDFQMVVRRLLNEFQNRYDRDDQLYSAKKEDGDLENRLQELVNYVSKIKPFILIIGGLDQLSDDNHSKLLKWLPKMPEGSKILLSAADNDATLDSLLIMDACQYVMPSFSIEHRKNLVVEYLKHFGKKLTDNQINLIASSSICDNIFVLRTLLEELRNFGKFENLDLRIRDYVEVDRVVRIFFKRCLKELKMIMEKNLSVLSCL